jgi:putative copper export protein
MTRQLPRRATHHLMLAPSWTTVRLFVHVLAATVWVGGQFTLAGLVPALRAAGPDVPKLAARAFNRVAWPAYGLLWLTGIWNLLVLPSGLSTEYMVTLFVKILVVLASGITAFLHARATVEGSARRVRRLHRRHRTGGAVPRHPPARLTPARPGLRRAPAHGWSPGWVRGGHDC